MQPQQPTHTYPILAVEDDRTARHILARVLEKSGHEVTTALNGKEALALMAQRHYPIVITDWLMPEMDGLELCEAIRKRSSPGYIYILLLTAKDTTEDIVAGLSAGADDYLRKPFQKEELDARLNTGIRFLDLDASLRQAGRYSESILDSMVDAVFVLNMKQEIVKVNSAGCRLLASTDEKLVGSNMKDFIDEDPEKVEAQCLQVIQNGHTESQELKVRTCTGEQVPVSFNSSVFYADPDRNLQNAGVICVARDMTDWHQAQKRLENILQELETTQEMLVQSEKLAAIGQLAAGIAHEILNPTNIVSIRLQLMQMTENLSEKALDALDICNAQLKRIVAITKDLGRFSRVSVKSVQPCDMNALIRSTLNLYVPELRLKGVVAQTELGRDLPPVRIDKHLIEEVLLNFFSNAVAAMQDSPEKQLSVRTALTPDGERLHVCVSDTGQGIPEKALNRVFDPYFSTKPHDEGTGLGLFLSYGIVKDQGGDIRLENNTPAPGATFCMEFPAIKP